MKPPPSALPRPALVLPPAARDKLIRASQIADRAERLAAIDRATDLVRMMFPQFFR